MKLLEVEVDQSQTNSVDSPIYNKYYRKQNIIELSYKIWIIYLFQKNNIYSTEVGLSISRVS